MISLAQSYGAEPPPGAIEDAEDTARSDEPEEDAVEVPSTTPIFVLQPKKDFYGLGFDPLKGAPEFRAAKRAKTEGFKGLGKGGNLFRPQAGKVGAGFGVGALEDVGEEDEDVYETELPMDQEVLEEEEQEAPPRGKAKDSESDLCAKLGFKAGPRHKLPGFRIGPAEGLEVQEWFEPPVVPKGFVARHKFVPEGLGFSGGLRTAEVPPPEDEELRRNIEMLAAFVANAGGEKLEEIARERNKGKAEFAFLFGGVGKEYYEWKNSELARKGQGGESRVEEKGPVDRGGFRKPAEFGGRSGRDRAPRMTAEDRGRLLGETPLPKTEDAKSVMAGDQKAGSAREALGVPGPVTEKPKSVLDMIAPEDRARLQTALAGTFTKGASQDMDYENPETFKPFSEDPAKQARYEAFLQARSVGGLRKPERNNGMSEEERLREKEEFEMTAQMVQQGLRPKPPPSPAHPALAFLGDRFAPAGEAPEAAPGSSRGSLMDVVAAMQASAAAKVAKKFPRREVEEWRPAPLVCRRFNILDPFAGKAPAPVKPRSQIDSLALLMPQFGQDVNPDFAPEKKSEQLALPALPGVGEYPPEARDVLLEEGSGQEPPALGIDKPIDLFKAIFSDSEDEEEGSEGLGFLGRPGEKAVEAATAALNRHVATEFLAQFGVGPSPAPAVLQPDNAPPVLFRPKGERKKGAEKEKKGGKKKATGLLSFEEEEEEQFVRVSKGVKEDRSVRVNKGVKEEQSASVSEEKQFVTVGKGVDDAGNVLSKRVTTGVGEAGKDVGNGVSKDVGKDVELSEETKKDSMEGVTGTEKEGTADADGREDALKESRAEIQTGEQPLKAVPIGGETQGGGVDLWEAIFEGEELESADQLNPQTEKRDGPAEGAHIVVQTGEYGAQEMTVRVVNDEVVEGPVLGPLPPDDLERAGSLESEGKDTGPLLGADLKSRRRSERNGEIVVTESEISEDESRRRRREKRRARRERGHRSRSQKELDEGSSGENEGERRRRKRNRKEERRKRRGRDRKLEDLSDEADEREEGFAGDRKKRKEISEGSGSDASRKERKWKRRRKKEERRRRRQEERGAESDGVSQDEARREGDLTERRRMEEKRRKRSRT
jgi:hypothetical protein